MKQGFTPGPWERVDTEDYAEIHPKVNGSAIALVGRASDANLIAIAPEMHDAMQEFVNRVEAGEVRSRRTYAKFKAILAKASIPVGELK